MNCDMCGKEAPMFKTLIEGVEMTVCKDCASFGQILRQPAAFAGKKQTISPLPKEPIIVEEIVEEYAIKIKQAREKKGLNQEEFARFLGERESILQKIESGKQKPTIELAKKLEKQLGIQLIERIEEEIVEQKKSAKGPLTIGDMLQKKQ